MQQWQKVLIKPNSQIVAAIEIIDKGGMQIAIVVDDCGCLVGTVTDGDVRRGILKGISLQSEVSLIMNQNPTSVRTNVSKAEIFELMKEKSLRHIPVVEADKKLARIETIDSILEIQELPNHVVLMAGGEGKRLFPLTKDTPKPLLKVGPKPILHTIVDTFVSQGFRNFFISVNYKAEMVENYFNDGSEFGAKISYLREPSHLGTAGSLSLIPDNLEDPFIVMNGDLLTKVNFHHLLDFHNAHGAEATVCVREYDFQVPYGVVSVEGEKITRIDEKPVQSFFVNGGIYVFSPKVFKTLKKNERLDMTDLLSNMLTDRKNIAAFPLREYWVDIGKADDFERAQGEFLKIFE